MLPLGATEPHNLHLPYGTDTSRSRSIADRPARRPRAQERGSLLLPAMPYGTETNQMRFPLAMNLNPSTLRRVITDLVDRWRRTASASACCSTATAATT